MELVSPSATTTATTPPQSVDADAPGQSALRLSVIRTALLGLVGSTAIVVGAVLGGQSFETHLPGAWFFGMPGGPFGSFGSNSSLPPIASLALVFGGLILLSRVWFGFLRHLNRQPRLPGEARRARRDDLGRAAAPRATALQPGRLHLRRAGRDDEPPHQPVLLRARGARGDAVQPDGRLGVVGDGVALRPHLPECGRPARPGLGPPDPARPRPAPPAGGRRHRDWWWPPPRRWPGRSNTTRPMPS